MTTTRMSCGRKSIVQSRKDEKWLRYAGKTPIAKGVLKLYNDKEYPVGKSLFPQIHQYLVSVISY